MLVTFEGDYSTYTNDYTPLSWPTVDPDKVWHIIYDVPTAADMESVVALSKARGAGFVYVTDAVLPNPYDVLPEQAYWDDEQVQVAPSGNPGLAPPSTPTGLSAPSVSSSQATIQWNASAAGSQPVAAYDVYADGAWLTSVPGDVTSYTASDLQPSTLYGFSVSARDAYGNSSGMSTQMLITTSGAAAPPSVPQDLTATATTFTSTVLTWTASTAAPGDSVSGYNVYVNNAEVLSVPASVTAVTVGGLASGGASYSLSVQAMGASGSLSGQSDTVTAVTQTAPEGLTIIDPSETAAGGTFTYSAQYLIPFTFYRVFINTGGTPCFYTGSVPQICANYVIENDNLFSYTGNGTDWEVSLPTPLAPVINGYQYTWSVPAADLGSPASQIYVFNGTGYEPPSYSGQPAGQAPQTLTPETSGTPQPVLTSACLQYLSGGGSGADGSGSSGDYAVSLSQIDLTISGPELGLTRQYSLSLASTLGPFGYGWTDSYSMTVTPDPTCGPSVMDVTLGDGSVLHFAQQTDGTWVLLSLVPATLVQNPDGTWTFTHNSVTFEFTSFGQLVSESEPGGGTTTLSYSNGLLTTVTDSAGNTFQFTYDGPLVIQVTGSDGQSVSYSYSDHEDLRQVTDADGGTWSYDYDWSHNLVSAAAPRGSDNSTLPSVCLQDPNRRGFGSDGDNGYAVSFGQTDLAVPEPGPALDLTRQYNSLLASTVGPFGYGWTDSYNMTVTPDPTCGPSVMDAHLGDGSVLYFAQQTDGTWTPLPQIPQAPSTLVQNPDGTWTFTHNSVTFEFTSFGQLVSESEPGGGTTTLSYSNGLLTTVTDSAGNTFQFTYDGPLVIQVTGSDGQSVSYSYSDHEDLRQVTDADGGTWSYSHRHHNLSVLNSPYAQCKHSGA